MVPVKGKSTAVKPFSFEEFNKEVFEKKGQKIQAYLFDKEKACKFHMPIQCQISGVSIINHVLFLYNQQKQNHVILKEMKELKKNLRKKHVCI